jgi:hypothetical protein
MRFSHSLGQGLLPKCASATVAVSQIGCRLTARKSAEAGKAGRALQHLISTAVRNIADNTTQSAQLPAAPEPDRSNRPGLSEEHKPGDILRRELDPQGCPK